MASLTPIPPAQLPLGGLTLQPLFPLALGQVQLAPDPLDTAVLLQEILALRGAATGNSEEGCAWTGDLHGESCLHHHPAFAPLLTAAAGSPDAAAGVCGRIVGALRRVIASPDHAVKVRPPPPSPPFAPHPDAP